LHERDLLLFGAQVLDLRSGRCIVAANRRRHSGREKQRGRRPARHRRRPEGALWNHFVLTWWAPTSGCPSRAADGHRLATRLAGTVESARVVRKRTKSKDAIDYVDRCSVSLSISTSVS